jgi:hypothetical protein
MENSTETRLRAVETRVETLLESIAGQLGTMNERLSDGNTSVSARIDDLRSTLHTWIVVMAAITAAHMAATIAIAVALFRMGGGQ